MREGEEKPEAAPKRDRAKGTAPRADAKRFNETLKEFSAFVRGVALSVIVFGAIRGGVDPAAWLGSARFASSILAGLAIQALNIYVVYRFWRKE